MTSGFEIAIAGRALAPLFQTLAKAATSQVKTSIAKWTASEFPEKLAQKLSSADRVKTIWSRDRFISLTECYYPSSIYRKHERVTIKSISELATKYTIIEGIVGQGKSMFLQYLYLQELSGYGSGGLPLLIFLRTITEKRNFDFHLKEGLSNLEIEPTTAVIDYLANSGRLILLLDGFDELDINIVTDTIGAIESLVLKYPNLRIIITSRPNSDIQKSPHFEVLQLSNLEPSDFAPFLGKLNVDIVRISEIITAIENSPADVAELISTPLMLTLVAHVYAAEKEIPSELPLFFERLFVTTFVGHDKQKGGGFRRYHHSGLSDRKLQLLFEAFCFLTLQKRAGRTLSGEQFANIFDAAENLVEDSACSVDQFKLDITKVSCLMLEDGFDQTSFLHMSIAEYFAAAYVKRSNENFAIRFYSFAVENHYQLKVVLSFLEKIDFYRFSKFYVLPPLHDFFKAIHSTSSREATEENWIDFIREFLPKLKISFGLSDKANIFNTSAVHYGPDLYKRFGPIAFDILSNAIIRAFHKNEIPETIFLENQNAFSHDGGDINERTYVTSFEGVLKVFGGEIFFKELRRSEQTLWIRFNQAQAAVRNEDAKTDLVTW